MGDTAIPHLPAPAAWLGDKRDAMIDLLKAIVSIDSGSGGFMDPGQYDKAGVEQVGAELATFLTGHGVSVTEIPPTNPLYSGCLLARVEARAPANRDAKPILLMGHRDTVFAKGDAATRPFHVDANGLARGPGVADMKGGLVLNSFVLAAAAAAGGLDTPLEALFTSDEEIGSPSSKAIIQDTARRARAVFNAEPARSSGNLVRRRKGSHFLTFRSHGQAAHSGSAHDQGISAIEELAHKVLHLHGLTDPAAGVTVSVGMVSGGVSANTVCPLVEATVDFRFPDTAARDQVLPQIHEIIATSHVAKELRLERNIYLKGTWSEIVQESGFLPLEETPSWRMLFDLYQSCAGRVGFDVGAEDTGGSADSGFTAAVGTATLCGTGPVGGNGHREDEYLVVDTLVPRAQALALAVKELAGRR